jgi:hypothetical protein
MSADSGAEYDSGLVLSMQESDRDKVGRTSLSDSAFRQAFAIVSKYFRKEATMTNSVLRSLTGLNYDQAIKFFNRAIADGLLERRGRASAVHYVPTQKLRK